MKPLLFFTSYITMAFLTWGYLVQRPERLARAHQDKRSAFALFLSAFWPLYWATEAAKAITKPN